MQEKSSQWRKTLSGWQGQYLPDWRTHHASVYSAPLMKSIAASNPECYAQRLCGCRGPVNREHIVSKGLLKAIWQGENGGRVRGLLKIPNPTPDDPVQIGIKALTATILCEGHNSACSIFDTEIVKLFQSMERLLIAESDGTPIGVNSYINGELIERWMCKTLVNGLFSGTFPAPFVNSFAGILPDEEALRIIFGNAMLPAKQGIYLSKELSRIDHQVFQLEVVGSAEGIVGIRMRILGSLYSLVLTDDPGAFPELTAATYRPAKIVADKTRNGIVFSWAGDSSSQQLEFSLMNHLPHG